MKTFRQFCEQIASIEPSEYTKMYQKSNLVSKRQQISHAHREMMSRATREQKARLKTLHDIEVNKSNH